MISENDNKWVFQLFVSEKSPRTDHALAILRQICKEHLQGKCEIKVIDISQNPLASIEENIIATPTLLKKLPTPARRIIGDILEKDKLLLGLEIIQKE